MSRDHLEPGFVLRLTVHTERTEVLNPGHLILRCPVFRESRLDDDLRIELVRYHNVWRLIKAVQAPRSLGLWARHDRGDLRSAPGRRPQCPPLQAIDLLPGEYLEERHERPVPRTHSSRGVPARLAPRCPGRRRPSWLAHASAGTVKFSGSVADLARE